MTLEITGRPADWDRWLSGAATLAFLMLSVSTGLAQTNYSDTEARKICRPDLFVKHLGLEIYDTNGGTVSVIGKFGNTSKCAYRGTVQACFDKLVSRIASYQAVHASNDRTVEVLKITYSFVSQFAGGITWTYNITQAGVLSGPTFENMRFDTSKVPPHLWELAKPGEGDASVGKKNLDLSDEVRALCSAAMGSDDAFLKVFKPYLEKERVDSDAKQRASEAKASSELQAAQEKIRRQEQQEEEASKLRKEEAMRRARAETEERQNRARTYCAEWKKLRLAVNAKILRGERPSMDDANKDQKYQTYSLDCDEVGISIPSIARK